MALLSDGNGAPRVAVCYRFLDVCATPSRRAGEVPSRLHTVCECTNAASLLLSTEKRKTVRNHVVDEPVAADHSDEKAQLVRRCMRELEAV
jgi:hypothetical protein